MGSRRLGRKRLVSLSKVGEQAPSTAGDGIKDAIASYTIRREGLKVLTEIVVDLGTSKADIVTADSVGDVIGKDAAENAALCTIDSSIHGHITFVEMVCLEVPVATDNPANDADVDLVAIEEKTAVQRQGFLSTGGTQTDGATTVEPGAEWTVGMWDGKNVKDQAKNDRALTPGMSLYLTQGGAIGAGGKAYTAGKFCITLEGWLEPDDI